MDDTTEENSQKVSRGLCNLPSGSTLISDPEEEVFLLYTSLAAKNVQDSSHAFRGLGYLDSHRDILTLEFTVQIPGSRPDAGQSRTRRKAIKKKIEEKTIEVQLAQDKTALHSRKGDTGSVLWRASMEFTQLILQQYHSRSPESLLDVAKLADAHILELGAGTGLLSILLSPLVRHYTVTDIDALIPLISKNLVLNSLLRDKGSGHFTGDTITVEALDWIALHKAPASSRRTLFPYAPIDLLLVVDCIYHPSLLPALVETIDYLATPNYTAVLVVVELRAEDVVRDFLELWSGAGEGCWEIWHAQNVMDGPYAVWLGWKKLPNK